MANIKWLSAGVLSGAAGVWGLKKLQRTFQHDLTLAQERLKHAAHTTQTVSGPIVYGVRGAGPPALVIHGAGGGFDQALHISQNFGDRFKWIAPSRFGYPGCPLPPAASPESQADVFAELLDALKIDQLPIIGLSAGGPSSLHFASRHPDRCTGLVLVSAVSKGVLDVAPNLQSLEPALRSILSNDFLTWLALQISTHKIVPPFGVPRSVISGLNQVDTEYWQVLLAHILPIQPRTDGLLNDYKNVLSPGVYRFEEIKVPTLIVHSHDDSLVPITNAYFSRNHIPGAQMLELSQGGHLFLGQRDRVQAAVEPFLLKLHPTH